MRRKDLPKASWQSWWAAQATGIPVLATGPTCDVSRAQLSRLASCDWVLSCRSSCCSVLMLVHRVTSRCVRSRQIPSDCEGGTGHRKPCAGNRPLCQHSRKAALLGERGAGHNRPHTVSSKYPVLYIEERITARFFDHLGGRHRPRKPPCWQQAPQMMSTVVSEVALQNVVHCCRAGALVEERQCCWNIG